MSSRTTEKNFQMFSQMARYAWLPIPLLLVAILGLLIADLQTVYESRSLMVVLNLFFTLLASLCISFLTAGGFLSSGHSGLLMFGCGSLLWGFTSLSAAMIVGSNVNPTITVHNLGALVAALCHLVGFLWKGQLKRLGTWLLCGYAVTLLASGLIFWAATLGLTPIFFIQGYGGTAVRYVALIVAIVTFAWVGWRMVSKFRLKPGSFYYWYGLGLALVATGLTGVLLLTVQGGVLGWANRLTQYLGSIYLFIAALMAARETGALSFAAKGNAWHELLPDFRQESRWGGARHYLLAIIVVGVAMGLRMAAESWIGHGLPPYITFYPAMMAVVLMTGFGPCIIASILTAFLSAYWILPPVGQFFITSPVDRLGLTIFTGMNLFMSVIAELYRRNRIKAAAYDREEALRESKDILRQQVELIDPIRAKIIAQEMQRVLRERAATNAVTVEPTGGTTQRLVKISGVIVASVGLLVLVGWAFGLERLTRILPGLAMMKANTALCFLVAGSALLFHEKHWVRLTCGGLTCMVSGLTLTEYISGGDFGLDQLLFLDVPDQHALYPGRMSAATAIGFLLSSASLLLSKARPHSSLPSLAIGVLAIGTVAVLGYMYDMQQLYRFFGFSSVALHTAVSFVVLGIGLLFAETDGLGTLLVSPGPGSHLMQWLLPSVLLLPASSGWLILMGLRQGHYGEGMSIALFAMTMIVLLSIIIWWSTITVNRGETVRRETENQLRNLTEVMNHAHEPLIVSELNGTIRAWNHGAEMLYGWSAADALGQQKQTLLCTAGHSIEELNRQLENEGRWEGELRQTTHDGRSIIVESRQTASHTSDGQVLILESNLNITERKQAEEALQESEKRLALTAGATQVGMFDLNLNNNKVFWTPAHDVIFGYAPVTATTTITTTTTEYDQQRWAERVHPEDLSLVEEVGHRCMQERKPIALQYRIIWPDGSLHWVETKAVYLFDRDGKANRMLGVVMDITERKRAEKALKENERTQRLLAQIGEIGTRLPQSGEMIEAICECVAKELGVSRCGFSQVDLETGQVTVLKDYHSHLSTLVGVYPMTGYADYLEDGLAGRAVAIEDTVTDPRTARVYAMNFAPIQVRAHLTVPLLHGGEWVANFWASHHEQHHWTAAEMIVMTLIADRMWLAIERQRVNEELRESEEKFRTLADSIPNLAWWANSDGYITWYNQRWYEYTGTTSEQMEGWGWQSVHDPDVLPKVMERWLASITTGEPFNMTFPLRGADGVFRSFLTRVIPLKDDTGCVQQWFGTNTDVSELKRIEQELRDSEERFRSVLDNSADVIYRVNMQSGRYEYISPSVEKVVGYSAREIMAMDVQAVMGMIHPDDQPVILAKLTSLENTNELDIEYRQRVKNGDYRWVSNHVAVFRDNTGQALYCDGNIRDVTEQKLAEMKIKASLTEKEVMLKEIHHRVKNNLQVISSLVSLQADNLTDDRIRDELNDVRDRVRSMALIHEKLYQASDLAELNFADYASSLLYSLWRSHGALAEKARLNLSLAPVALSIEAAVPCGLILNELAGNALKHAFPNVSGGEVIVGLEHDPSTGTINLRVRDNGVGLPDGQEWQKSRSLGLRLVQILTNQLRGTVDVTTGPGTEFQITFPSNGTQS